MTTIEIICTVTVAVITVLGGIYAMFQFIFQVGKTKEHLEGFERSIRESFIRIDNRFEKVDDSINELKETVGEHTMALVELYTTMGRKYPKRSKAFAKKRSPRALTELGEKIYGDIGGAALLAANKNVLFEHIDKAKPLTRLDVEMEAQKALMALSFTPVFNPIKDYVYDASEIDLDDGTTFEMTIGDICFILSIPLRDMYINERGIH